jgi:hypothetical protein
LNYFNDLEYQGQIYFNKVLQTTSSLMNIGNPLNLFSQINSNPRAFKSFFSQLINFVDL